MPAKIRLTRHGKKHQAYYHIVVADGRAPRDGKYIEVIGNYNPNTNPATIVLDNDKAIDWLRKGAQPTDTVRAILSYKGVLFKSHLNRGVAKGLLTQEQADAKLQQWLDAKQIKIDDKKKKLAGESEKERATRLAAESKKREAIAEAVLKKNTPPPAEEAPVAEAEAAPEAPAAEAAPEAPAAE
jgi:small subunit ribosomal protein S16